MTCSIDPVPKRWLATPRKRSRVQETPQAGDGAHPPAGCYLGYVRAFTVVVSHLTAARKVDDIAFTVHDSKSKQEAIRRAREAFGPDHWTADDDLQLRYYNTERGFWMYSQNDERVIEEDGVRYDGKRIKLRPAAIIWRAQDGSSTKTVTAEEAIIDFNQPLGVQRQARRRADGRQVRPARAERHDPRRPRDARDPTDDMVIGPLTWVDYDDSKLQIHSDSDVLHRRPRHADHGRRAC